MGIKGEKKEVGLTVPRIMISKISAVASDNSIEMMV